MRTDGRPDRQMAPCSITQGRSAAPGTSHSPLHTHNWSAGRQKKRALDSFKRIKEAEERIETRRGDLQIWTRDASTLTVWPQGLWRFFFFFLWMKTASLDNKAWLVLGFFLPSFGSIGFKFQTSAASEERRDRCSAEKKAKKSAVASPLCVWFSHQLLYSSSSGRGK